MLAHCINDACNRALHSFSEGRLFQFEVVSISVAACDENSAPFDERPQRQTLHLWLCGRCASTMTLVLEPTRGVKVVPLEQRGDEGRETSTLRTAVPHAKQC